MIKELTQLLGTTKPFFIAPIGSLISPEMLGGAAEGGSMGFLPATWLSLDTYKKKLDACIKVTHNRFGVNFVVDQITRKELEQKIEYALAQGVKNFSFSWGDPTEYTDLIKKIHAKKGVVFQTVGTVKRAESAVKADVDVIIAQGIEAGGHVEGEEELLKFLPKIVALTKDKNIPVLAAGGIANGAQIAEVQNLGAAGALLGTAFIVAHESLAHPDYKKAIIHAIATDTVLTKKAFTLGWYANLRVLKTEETKECLADKKQQKGEIIAHRADGTPIHCGEDWPPLQDMKGEIKKMAFYAGMGVDHIIMEQSTSAILRQLEKEYVATLTETTVPRCRL